MTGAPSYRYRSFGLHRNARPINGTEELAELLESVW